MIDAQGRRIDYLRLSVTDRCNLRCLYCLPPTGVQPKAHGDILRYEEMELLVRAGVLEGIRKVRITGGEPLVRRDLVQLVRMLSRIPDLQDLSLTTNGELLAEVAADLRKAGLRRVNISLDSLDPDTYRRITRGGELRRVLRGLEAALAVGLHPVKINVVLLRGLNQHEVDRFVEMARSLPVAVRFIELMPLGEAYRRHEDYFLPVQWVIDRLGPGWHPVPGQGGGPAVYWGHPDAAGTIGCIAALSEHLCARCNRIRVGAAGEGYACLSRPPVMEFRSALRRGADLTTLRMLFRKLVASKPAGHAMARRHPALRRRLMAKLGG